jgi:hypothetical protein
MAAGGRERGRGDRVRGSGGQVRDERKEKEYF